MRYRKSGSNTQLISLRVDGDVYNMLRHDYGVNINAQVNHYLNNLLSELILHSDKRVFVYTKWRLLVLRNLAVAILQQNIKTVSYD